MDRVYFLCIETDEAIIGGHQIYIQNYVGLRLDVQYCPEYRPKEECDLAAMSGQWASLDSLMVTIDYRQVELKDQEEPLHQLIRFQKVQSKLGFHGSGDVYLAPNEFTDKTDRLGLFNYDYDPQKFLTFDSFLTNLKKLHHGVIDPITR